MKNFKAHLKHGGLNFVVLIRGISVSEVTKYIKETALPNDEYKSLRVTNEPVTLEKVESV